MRKKRRCPIQGRRGERDQGGDEAEAALPERRKESTIGSIQGNKCRPEQPQEEINRRTHRAAKIWGEKARGVDVRGHGPRLLKSERKGVLMEGPATQKGNLKESDAES